MNKKAINILSISVVALFITQVSHEATHGILAGLVGLSIGWTVALGVEAALLSRLVYGVAANADAGIESPAITRKHYGEYTG